MTAMDTNRTKFPKLRSDGSAVVNVCITASDVTTSHLCQQLSAWLANWWTTAPTFVLSGRTFSPQRELVSPPAAAATDASVVLTLHLRDGQARLWKDWFAYDVLPKVKSLIPSVVVNEFASPED